MKTAPPEPAPTRAEIVDEFGELDRQVQQFKPRADRHETLKKIIKSWYDAAPAGQTAIAAGDAYEIQISAKTNESYIPAKSMPALYKAVGGAKAFLEFVRGLITKKALVMALGETKAAEYFVQDQVGSRRLKAILKAAPEYKEAA